jgi:heat shock protein HslJ
MTNRLCCLTMAACVSGSGKQITTPVHTEPRRAGPRLILVRFLALALRVAVLAGAYAACASAPTGAGTSSGWPTGRTFVSTSLTGHTLVAGTRISLTFHRDGTLSAHAGCNYLSGPGRLSGGRLIIGQLKQTLIGCDPDRMSQDHWLASFLTAKPQWHLAGDQLHLTSGTARLTLTA